MYNMSGRLPLFLVNALKVSLTKAFFQDYWWSLNWQGQYNVNMVVAIFLLIYIYDVNIITFCRSVTIVFYFSLRKMDFTLWCPFSFHDEKKISYILFWDNCTTLKLCPYMHIFPLCPIGSFAFWTKWESV